MVEVSIQTFADIIGETLIIKRFPNQNERWTAQFDHCDVRDVGTLKDEYGTGVSPWEALKDYATKISGKRVVFNALSDERREYNTPENLTIG